MNERIADLAGMMAAMASQNELSDNTIAVCADKLKALKDDIQKEQERYKGMVEIIDETMEAQADGKWALLKVKNENLKGLDLKGLHIIANKDAFDKEDGKDSIMLFDEEGQLKRFDNIDGFNAFLKESGLVEEDITLTEADFETMQDYDLLDGSVLNVEGPLQELYQKHIDREFYREQEMLSQQQKALDAEGKKVDLDEEKKNGVAKFCKEFGINPADYPYHEQAAILKSKNLAYDYHANTSRKCLEVMYNKDGVLPDLGLRIQYKDNECREVDNIKLFDKRTGSDIETTPVYFTKKDGTGKATDLLQYDENYKQAISILAKALPEMQKDAILGFVKESKQAKDRMPEQFKEEPTIQQEKDSKHLMQALYNHVKDLDGFGEIEQHGRIVSASTEDGVRISAMANDTGKIIIYRDDEGLSNSNPEEIKANAISVNGRNMVNPEKEEKWAENYAKTHNDGVEKDIPAKDTNVPLTQEQMTEINNEVKEAHDRDIQREDIQKEAEDVEKEA